MTSLLDHPESVDHAYAGEPALHHRHLEEQPRPDDDDENSELRLGRARPCGLAPGGLAFAAAWLVGVAIARLTGAAAVVLLLVVTTVALGASMIAGWIRLRSIGSVRLTAPKLVTEGETFELRLRHEDNASNRTPVTALVRSDHSDTTARVELVEGASSRTMLVPFTMTRAGTVNQLEGSLETNGTAGLIWWRRPVRLPINPLHVAPVAVAPALHVDEQASTDDGSSTDGRGRPIGDIDGIRPWRQGESDQAIHWPSTIRSGSIVARARRSAVETRWTTRLDQNPGQLRWTLEQGMRHGHDVHVELPDGTTSQVRNGDDAARWATIAADLQRPAVAPTVTTPIWKRTLSLTSNVEETSTIGVLPRWSTAVAAAVGLNMLLGALDATLLTRVVATAGIVAGAVLAVRFRHQAAPLGLRLAVVAIAVGALARITAQASGIGGLIDALRGPMPDLLMLLLVLHGVESTSRRTVRVHLAFTGVVVAYAAGLRIDDRVGWWMLGWGTATLIALATLSWPESQQPVAPRAATPRAVTPRAATPRAATPRAVTPRAATPRAATPRAVGKRWGRSFGWFLLATMVTFGLASLVPIPDGPASLGLPAVSNNDAVIDDPGTLAGPAGDTPPPPSSGPSEAPNRGALGEVAGYPGFSETLDTSVRGDLGDEIVMRVRAPEPAFWRGQTFTEFDGRTWRITPTDGPNIEGPQIDVAPTLGDLPASGIPTEEFVQTYHVETDLPNVIFAASRPETVIFDGTVNTRPDGALRADRTLTDGTIYTVVSERVQVTPQLLSDQGDIAARFAGITDPRAGQLLAPYLALPDSTSERTVALADQLSVEGSTYDTILAYENWLSINTEYDLNAPVPADGADAVDDYLFESRRGFCEQIASSLVVMLRSQGVPARLATGYIPGERDQVSGVWKVRASDAHAWVEVWFPDTGWGAFDPTASVPLAGDTAASTVGSDVADAVVGGIASRPAETGLVLLLAGSALASVRGVAELRRRRERGPWGILHDRFVALEPDSVTVQDAADALATLDPSPDPHAVAEMLDRVAFDPTFTPTSNERSDAARTVRALERSHRRSR